MAYVDLYDEDEGHIPYLSNAIQCIELAEKRADGSLDKAERLNEAQAEASVALVIAVRELVELLRDRLPQ